MWRKRKTRDKKKLNLSKIFFEIKQNLKKTSIVRFIKKNIILAIIFIISLIICLIYCLKIEKDNRFFNFVCNIALAYIGSVIVYFITDFRSKDQVYIKYEKKILEYFKCINYKMKKISYIILEKEIYWKDELETIREDDLKKDVYTIRKRIGIDKWSDDPEKINVIENEIADKIIYIMTSFRSCLSEEDIQLMVDIQNTELRYQIQELNKNYNEEVDEPEIKFGTQISREQFLDHIEKQNMLEKRIQELSVWENS